MIILYVKNIHIVMKFKDVNEKTESYILNRVHQQLDPLDPNRFHKRAYTTYTSKGERLWDGRVKLCDFTDPNKLLIPIGLYNDLIKVLNDIGYREGANYKVQDQRQAPFKVALPDSITLDGQGKEKTLTLRDYQYQSVTNAFVEQSGILLEATNSGKTSCALAIYKYLLDKISNNEHLLFIAPNSSIMNQLYDKFRHYLGDNNVGVWGDGKKDLNNPIVVATIQTIASAIKKPKDKLTRKNDRLIERIATKYAPAILQSGSPKANLKLLAMNFKPKYKYEADDVDVLRNMAVSYDTDQDVIGAMKAYQKKYKHLVYKLNQKGFDKYYSAIEFLHSVVAVICDEAHFAGAMSYWNVFQYLTNARMRIGMTGTLDKSKKIHMARIKSLLGVPIINVTNKQMIDRGVSAKPYIKLVPVDKPTNLEQQVGAIAQKQGVMGGSTADLMLYQIAYKIGVVQNQYRNNLIARLAIATAKQLNKQAVLIIVNSIEQGENICAELDQYQAEYAFIQGKDDSDTREEALQRVRNGELKILIGTKIIDTGIDVDAFKALILCSAGKSYISLLQRIGRVLRIRKDKKKVIIFDLFDRTSKILYKHGKQRVKYYKDQGFDVS